MMFNSPKAHCAEESIGCQVRDVCIIEVHAHQSTQQPSAQSLHELRIAFEACHCQRKSKEQGTINLESQGFPLVVPKTYLTQPSASLGEMGLCL